MFLENILLNNFRLIKHTCFEDFIFNIMLMGNNSVIVETGFVWAFQ